MSSSSELEEEEPLEGQLPSSLSEVGEGDD